MKNAENLDQGQRRTTENRRRFILDRLHRFGSVSYSELHRAFGEGSPRHVNRASLNADITAIQKTGYTLKKKREGKDQVIFWTEGRTLTVKQFRESTNIEAKEAIAIVVGSLLCGFEPGEAAKYGLGERFFAKGTILDRLDSSSTPFPPIVKDKLARLWKTRLRSVAIDSGTSTDAIARALYPLEVPNSQFSHLDLWTNSRSIFELTGAPDCKITTIVLGGQQRQQSETICGELTKICLDAWNPSFSVSVIGATTIDRRVAGAYNASEGAIKGNLLSRGGLKILVADSSKFSDYPLEASSSFVEITPDFVDCIVTDSKGKENVKSINSVPVLSADEFT